MCVQKILGLKFFLGPVKLLVHKFLGLKNVASGKKFGSQKKFRSKEVWSLNILVHKNDDPHKNWVQKVVVRWGRVVVVVPDHF